MQARELGLPEQGPAVDEEHVAEGYKWIQTDEDVEVGCSCAVYVWFLN